MSEAAIFIYGLAVFAIVSAACWLIIWGIIEERHDREQLDAGPGAHAPSADIEATTTGGGATLSARRSD